MALIKLNPLLEDIRGKLGDMYVAKYGNQYRFKRRPKRKPEPGTAAQIAVRRRLIDSNGYWKRVKADPQALAVYSLAGKLRQERGCDLAKSDFSHPPTVTNVDLAGYIGQASGTIRIGAEDDFEVLKVSVRILGLDGTLLEEGDATLDASGGAWTYPTKATIPAGTAVVVEATAVDRPVHTDTKKVDHVCGPRV